MRNVLFALVFFSTSIFSISALSLTFDEATHFLARTGFQPGLREINRYIDLDKNHAINQRIAEIKTTPHDTLSTEFKTPYIQTFSFKGVSREARMEFQKKQHKKMKALQSWWLKEMINTDSPFTENLTLFWHNHFVSSALKIKRPVLVAMQNLTLRRNAAGNFRTFLNDILQDPAMILYLDNHKNRKGKLNENLARELLELFTIGEGNYSESDITTVAKILTGYQFDNKIGLFKFNYKQHDNTLKTLWQKSGHFLPKDLVELILSKPETAEFITKKLWNHFITTSITAKKLNQLSTLFRQDYEIKTLLIAILKQPEFWADKNRGSQIKSPMQLIVGLHRQFEIQPENLKLLNSHSKQMGQDILFPPNVKGWVTDEDWINTSTLSARQNFINQISRGMRLVRTIKSSDYTNTEWNKLLNDPEKSKIRISIDEDPHQLKEKLKSVLMQPEYQLQ